MHTTADITGTTLSAKLSGKADELAALSNVRFRGQSGHRGFGLPRRHSRTSVKQTSKKRAAVHPGSSSVHASRKRSAGGSLATVLQFERFRRAP